MTFSESLKFRWQLWELDIKSSKVKGKTNSAATLILSRFFCIDGQQIDLHRMRRDFNEKKLPIDSEAEILSKFIQMSLQNFSLTDLLFNVAQLSISFWFITYNHNWQAKYCGVVDRHHCYRFHITKPSPHCKTERGCSASRK